MRRRTPVRGLEIDTTFDFRTDAHGKDPDFASPTLRRYHQLLWSKPLPCGQVFDLDPHPPYLHHHSSLGEFVLSSDAAVPTYLKGKNPSAYAIELTRREARSFGDLRVTIGARMVFPARRVAGKPTINGLGVSIQRLLTGWISRWNASGATVWTSRVLSPRR